MKHVFTFIASMIICVLFIENVAAQNPPGPPEGTKSFYVTVYLEGLYDVPQTQMRKAMDHDGNAPYPRYNGSIADVITVELHVPGSYGTPAFTHANVNLNQNGTAVAYLPETGIYYLTIRHRNHLETVSATTLNLSLTNSYNFTDAASKAYGNNQKLLASGVWGIYAGDVNQDGVINANDRSSVQSQLLEIANGYVSQDINGDGSINANDRSIVQSALLSIIQKITP